MKKRERLRFELLGAFVCGEEEESRVRNSAILDKTGKKALSFLQYLLVNHARNISSEELIEQFWPEDGSSNPANALKSMLFKIRNLLKNMFPDQESLIRTLQGCYAWNPAAQLWLDTEEFESRCLKVRNQSGPDCLEQLLSAVSLYKGDFLSGNDSGWAASLRRYYQTLYLDACKTLLPLLQEEKRWTEMIRICEQASAVDFGSDVFIVCQMQALIALGYPDRAVEAYQAFRKLLWEEFEAEPTEQAEQLHILADSMRKSNMGALDALRLAEDGRPDDRAFFCTFGVFQSIVALEKRHLERSGQSSVLALVSLGNQITPTTDARRLERILLEGLKAGDPVARLDASSYILMLSGVSEENARLAMERLDRSFHKAYSHSRACICFRLSVLRAGHA